MSHRYHPQPVENYTNAFLTAFGVLIFMVLWTIAALAGYLWVFLTAWGVDRVSTFVARRSAARF